MTEANPNERLLLAHAQLAERFAGVAAAAPGVIFSLIRSAEGTCRFVFLSDNRKVLLGVEASDLPCDAHAIVERIHRQDRVRLTDEFERCAASMTLWRCAFRYDHPQNGEIWLEARAVPARQQNGEAIWHGYAHDITDQKRSVRVVAEQAAKLEAIIEGAHDGIFTLNERNGVISANDAAHDMFGWGNGQLVGVDLGSLLFRNDQSEPFAAFAGSGVTAGRGRRSNGELFPAEFAIKRVAVDYAVLSVVFVKDLTERERDHRRIEQLKLEQLSAISSMTTILAHQINQPLTAAGVYLKVAQRLLERLPGEIGANIGDTIAKAAGQTSRAGEIVRSLRELVAHGEPDKTLVSLDALIREALALVARQAADAGVSIRAERVENERYVIADGAQLKQVLLNLTQNAIEAMQGAAHRQLTISTTAEGGVVRVEISDTGPGLGELDGARLVEPFSTSNSSSMGIGLPMARAIIEAHYGRLWGKPNPEGGAIFGFELPMRE